MNTAEFDSMFAIEGTRWRQQGFRALVRSALWSLPPKGRVPRAWGLPDTVRCAVALSESVIR